MQYNIWFNICGLIILTILLVLYYMKFRAPFKKYYIFLGLLWSAFFSTVASICNNTLPGIAPVWIIRISNILYFVAHGMIPPVLLLYVYSLTDYSLRDWQKLLPAMIPSIFSQLLVMTSWYSDTIFWLDELGGYHRGPMMPLLYAITVGYFILIFCAMLRNRRIIPRTEWISVMIFLALSSGAVVIQLFFPHMLVENFSSAVCMMISQLTVQSPERILDGGTGMLNKKGFSDLLSPAFERHDSVPVGFLVLDNYHELERSYGFDRLESRVRLLAEYLKAHAGCTFARMENRLICFVPDNFRAGDAWDALLLDLEQDRLQQHLISEKMGIRFRLRVGVLDCPADADSFGSLMELIDIAEKMPQDQEQETVRLSAVDVQGLRRRKRIGELVRRAVKEESLSLVFQPVYSVAEGRFSSAEALLRMRTEEMGFISPAEFIRIAEENGAIVQLTQYVLEQVCRLLSSSELKMHGLKRIHINLSPVDCMQSDLVSRFTESLQNYRVESGSISVELTETVFVETPEGIMDSLMEFSRSGITIMLDDYGTGYSNLNRLRRMPVDVVKLDKSLVDDIMTSESARIILENTIRMMKALGKHVLAEGVETAQQADYLRSHGCDYIQGYYYAKPMDAAHLEALFQEQADRAAV